jgi:hypothetical protein
MVFRALEGGLLTRLWRIIAHAKVKELSETRSKISCQQMRNTRAGDQVWQLPISTGVQ